MPQETTTIWVCQDCLFVHANGESEGMPADKKPFSLIDDGDSVSLGMMLSEHGQECQDNGESVDDCECEQITFSWTPCEACGDSLGGDRHAMTIFHN